LRPKTIEQLRPKSEQVSQDLLFKQKNLLLIKSDRVFVHCHSNGKFYCHSNQDRSSLTVNDDYNAFSDDNQIRPDGDESARACEEDLNDGCCQQLKVTKSDQFKICSVVVAFSRKPQIHRDSSKGTHSAKNQTRPHNTKLLKSLFV
jgi:hypothetical protein